MWIKLAALAIIITIFGLIFFDAGFIASKYIKPNLPFINKSDLNSGRGDSYKEITGTLHINGQIPAGSSVNIGVREHGSSGNFTMFAEGLAALDDGSWSYTNALEGKTYEFQAYLIKGKEINTKSDIITITAPAGEEVLTLNIESVSDSPIQATISGTLFINGYIPQGATFDIMGRKYGSTGDFSEIVDNLPATIKRTITYSSAIAGQKYEILGQLFDSTGAVIGTSGSVVLSAPSDNAQMTINSTAQPAAGSIIQIPNNNSTPPSSTSPAPGGNAVISGTINFNGSAPGGSSIVILAKQASDPSYQVVASGIAAQNGSTWSWNGAIEGITYSMVAVLKVPQNQSSYDAADSQTYTVAAPAQNQLFTLNTGISLGAPTGSVSITCGTKNNNIWNGTVNFSSVTGAQYYSFQVGSNSGESDIANIAQAAQPTANQTISVSNLKDSVTYYAQYAVSSISNPTPAQLSPYSQVYTLKCPN